MDIGKGSVICDTARIIGKVRLGRDCFVLFGAVIRGDSGEMVLGDRVNIQDNCVLHSDPGFALTIGNDVSLGHSCVVHGCTIGDACIIGIGATVLNGAKVGKGCIIGAGAVVPERMVIPDHSLVVGVPAKIVKTNPAFEERCLLNAQVYGKLKDEYAEGKHEIWKNSKL